MSLKEDLLKLDLSDENFLELDSLLRRMVDQIGSPDSELRDKLIYGTFCKLINDGYLTESQLSNLLVTLLDDQHLFFKIGEKDTDSVFTRSFSASVIALILYKDREQQSLSDILIKQAIESGLTYLQNEVDTRGHVEGKGWAHAVAHGADLLDEAIRHPLFHMDMAEKSLRTIEKCLTNGQAYFNEEDERLITPIEALLEIGLNDSLLSNWLIGISLKLAEIRKEEGFSIFYFRKKTTFNSFIKTLYFRLKYRNIGTEIRGTIENILKEDYRKVYG
ncbi:MULTISPECIES: DUF2785 domain-containing protein [unclassified Bacillus (in: firmicutes)]|uniref:DUF2785 domain-containing protein n=1 Tax=unclassified Bacillus (in: firmicutes) TaxID=185979 RepID=UPI0008E09867|nr:MULTISPECIES: DUF2785 domain-containing protein [unclassified Bacillus (in: firmicutes)]SFA85415.1 Protein of unknown function [Bacillus sp. UNCCL13]SFQ83403.1 Protein of unknown function [Bacillus sp. cl95]